MKIFTKINKNNYPKIAQKWSWTVYFSFPIFTIGNKLYPYFFVVLAASLIDYSIYFFKFQSLLFDIIYVVSFAASLFTVIYLIIYGRISAWERLGYKNNAQDINKFKNRQKKILIWSIIYYLTLMILMFIFAFNLYLNEL